MGVGVVRRGLTGHFLSFTVPLAAFLPSIAFAVWPSSYDLSSASRLRSMYATVLREAGSEADLIEWLDCRLLLQHWSELNLPAFTRSSWESKHPELRGRASWR
jgi:hypothetical protein